MSDRSEGGTAGMDTWVDSSSSSALINSRGGLVNY